MTLENKINQTTNLFFISIVLIPFYGVLGLVYTIALFSIDEAFFEDQWLNDNPILFLLGLFAIMSLYSIITISLTYKYFKE